jgi:hypothetical protein
MVISCLFLVILILPQTAPMYQPAALPPDKVAKLQNGLAAVIQAALPKPLYEGSSHWGETVRAANGLKWVNSGGVVKPEIQYGNKNHGTWRKYLVVLEEPASDHLRIALSNALTPGNNTLTFDLQLDCDLHFDITQQNWKEGIKLFDGSVRGNVHFTLVLQCESKLTIDFGENYLPTVKYRLRVTDAKPSYDHLKVTHIAGVGGELAKKLGDWSREAIQQWKPSLERKLIDKLTQKIIKAADTKEIQLSLSGLERKKEEKK